MKKLKVALPKGSLEKSTYDLFKRAGFTIKASSRSYTPSIDDPEIEVVLFRPQEMSRYIEDGIVDCGLTGHDWIVENGSKVKELCELQYSKQTTNPIRWVLAVPENSKIKKAKDLQGKRISTELVGATKKYLKKHKVKAEVEFSWGATEAKPPILADAIVECTETGSSLRANKLKIIDTLITSIPKFISNTKSYENSWKKKKMDQLVLLLKGAIRANDIVGLKMNVAKKNLEKVIEILPAMKQPTISFLTDDNWFGVETVIEESIVREIIPALKSAGATGIIEYSLNKVIP